MDIGAKVRVNNPLDENKPYAGRTGVVRRVVDHGPAEGVSVEMDDSGSTLFFMPGELEELQ